MTHTFLSVKQPQRRLQPEGIHIKKPGNYSPGLFKIYPPLFYIAEFSP